MHRISLRALGLTVSLVWSSAPVGAQNQPMNFLPAPTPASPAAVLPANIESGQPANPIKLLAVPEPVAAPAAPVTVPALDLQACLALGMQRQPALRAAQASLSAAITAQQALDNLKIGFLSRDFAIRKEQACVGVTIASAGVAQAEWEARYAITRMYYTVQYARMQKIVVDELTGKLETSQEKAGKILEVGDPKSKITKIDVDILKLNIRFVRTKQVEADVGILRAIAGLREAIGLGCDEPFVVADQPLPELVPDLNREQLIAVGLAQRAELQQALGAKDLTSLEIAAQHRLLFKPLANTFAVAADIHAKPIPQGVANGEYRPGALGLEMPTHLAGKRNDRVQRAGDFDQRAQAVVDKTHNLIALEIDATYLKWKEAFQKSMSLQGADKEALEVANSVQNRFDSGNATGEEILRTRTMVDQARASYNEALFNHALALAALERVTAGGFRLKQ